MAKIEFERFENGCCVIRLAREEKLNVLDLEMLKEMKLKLEEWMKADNNTLLLFEGKGKAFCAGKLLQLTYVRHIKRLITFRWRCQINRAG